MVFFYRFRILIIIVVVFLFSSNFLLGQRIEGAIIDQHKNPISYAEIIIRGDKNFVTKILTDVQGKFREDLPYAGSYDVDIYKDGHSYYNDKMNLGDTSQVVFNTTYLGAQKNTFEVVSVHDDALVFDLSQSQLLDNGSLLNTLKNISYLRFSDDNQIFYSKDTRNLVVILDGKIMSTGTLEFQNHLKNIICEDVSHIQIKNNKEGTRVLEITTIAYESSGWSSDFVSNFNQATYASYSNNFSINYQNSRISSSLRINQGSTQKYNSIISNLIGDQSVTSNGTNDKTINSGLLSKDIIKQKMNDIGANFALYYKINKKSTIAVFYNINKTKTSITDSNTSEYQYKSITDSILSTSSVQQIPALFQTINTYYQLKLDSLGKKMSIGGNYFYNVPVTENNFITTSDRHNKTLDNYTWNKVFCMIWSGQIDFTLPYPWATIETGAKYAHYMNNADSKFYDFKNNTYLLNSENSSQFDYSEKNIAAYISFSKKFNESWFAKIGTRYEYSIVNAVSLDAYGNEDKSSPKLKPYDNLFPFANVNFTPNKDNIFTFNYNRIISRPSFSSLTRYKKYSNPFSFSSGNEILTPTYTHRIELAYHYKSIISASIFGEKTVNDVGQIVQFSNGVNSAIFKNYMDYKNLGFTFNLNTAIQPWWQNNATVTGLYSESKSLLPSVISLTGFSFNYNLENVFCLNESKTLYLLVNFFHQLPFSKANTFTKGNSNFSTGIRWALLNQKLKIDATAIDIFKGQVIQSENRYNTYTIFNSNYMDSRSFGLNVSYSFGNNKVKAVQKQTEFEDLNRTN